MEGDFQKERLMEKEAFSAGDLAKVRLPGLPKTARALLDLMKSQEWPFVELRSAGRGGVKREYSPPPELLELIRRHMRGEDVTEEEVSRARAIRSVAFRKPPAGLADYQQAPGRGQREGAPNVIDADERHSASAAPSPSGVAGPAAAGAPTVAATATPAPGAHAGSGRLTDPTDEDRLQMLLALLRTMEHHLMAPVSAEVAARMLEVVEAWHDFAARQPDILARLEAVRAAANLYLVR